MPAQSSILKNLKKAFGSFIERYVPANYQHTKHRADLATFLEKIGEYIDSQKLDETAQIEAYQSALVFGLETIALKYKWLSPEGSNLNKGSDLYKILLKDLTDSLNKTDTPNFAITLNNKEKFIYLEKFYNNILSKDEFSEFLLDDISNLADKSDDINLSQAGDICIQTMQALVLRLSKEIKQCTHSYPSEKYLDQEVNKLLENYRHAVTEKKSKHPWLYMFSTAENNDRVFLAQLVMATVKTMKAEDVIDKTEAPFNFALKIKLGALIYAMQSIEDAYENSLTNHFPINYVIKPENSDLYKLGMEILKVEKLSDYPEEVRMSCLAAFKIYMNNAETLQAIAKEGTVSFQPNLLKDLQLKNEKLQQALVSMLAPYLGKNKISWNMLFAFAILGGYFIGGPLAYGMGEMFGTQMGELNQALDAKVWLSKNIITPIGAMHNFDQIGFLMSDQAVKDILGRFVAKLLEPVGMLVAGVVLGGTVGLSLDLAYKC